MLHVLVSYPIHPSAVHVSTLTVRFATTHTHMQGRSVWSARHVPFRPKGYRLTTLTLLEPSPEAKASSIIDSLPGNSLISKTTWVTLGAGLTAFGVSNELYVANDETVILAGFLIFATLLGRSVSTPYRDWADATIAVRTRQFAHERVFQTHVCLFRISNRRKSRVF